MKPLRSLLEVIGNLIELLREEGIEGKSVDQVREGQVLILIEMMQVPRELLDSLVLLRLVKLGQSFSQLVQSGLDIIQCGEVLLGLGVDFHVGLAARGLVFGTHREGLLSGLLSQTFLKILLAGLDVIREVNDNFGQAFLPAGAEQSQLFELFVFVLDKFVPVEDKAPVEFEGIIIDVIGLLLNVLLERESGLVLVSEFLAL